MAARHLKSVTAALIRLKALLNKGDVSSDSCMQHMGRIHHELRAAVGADGAMPFGTAQKEVELAAFATLTALAHPRHARNWEWLRALGCVLHGTYGVITACEGEPMTRWVRQHCPAWFPSVVPLLQGIVAVVTSDDAPLSEAPVLDIAAACLMSLTSMLRLSYSEEGPVPRQGWLEPVAAATQLASVLYHGGVSSGPGGPCCCCPLAPASATGAARGSPGPGSSPGPGRAWDSTAGLLGATFDSMLTPLAEMHVLGSRTPDEALLLASKGGHLLLLQELAQRLARERQPRPPTAGAGRARRGGSGGGAAGSGGGRRAGGSGGGGAAGGGATSEASSSGGEGVPPTCADLSFFLAERGRQLPPDSDQEGPACGPVAQAHHALLTLRCALTAPGAAGACPICTPQQLRLVLEGVTRPLTGVQAYNDHDLQFQVLAKLQPTIDACHQADPGAVLVFWKAAVPTLVAWLVGAADLAGVSGSGSGSSRASGGGGGGGSSGRVDIVANTLIVMGLMMLHGGLMHSPWQHDQADVQRFLGSMELALRRSAGHVLQEMAVESGSGVLACFIDRIPNCFEDMWACGALPALVITLGKAAQLGGAHKLTALLRSLHPQPGQQPWYEDSTAKQQFILLVLAAVGGRVAAAVLDGLDALNGGGGSNSLGQAGGQLTSSIFQLLRAAQQLGQPLLRQHLVAAAPALLPRVDALSSDIRTSPAPNGSADSGLLHFERDNVQLLVDLGRQLDPLALGLSLPGCQNPACTSLVGVSEAAMVLKRCTACKVARYCDAACAKAHWRHHKASCRRETAARQAADGQQQA